MFIVIATVPVTCETNDTGSQPTMFTNYTYTVIALIYGAVYSRIQTRPKIDLP